MVIQTNKRAQPLDPEMTSVGFAELVGCRVDELDLTTSNRREEVIENYIALLPFSFSIAKTTEGRQIAASAVVHTCLRKPSAFYNLQDAWAQGLRGGAQDEFDNHLGVMDETTKIWPGFAVGKTGKALAEEIKGFSVYSPANMKNLEQFCAVMDRSGQHEGVADALAHLVKKGIFAPKAVGDLSFHRYATSPAATLKLADAFGLRAQGKVMNRDGHIKDDKYHDPADLPLWLGRAKQYRIEANEMDRRITNPHLPQTVVPA